MERVYLAGKMGGLTVGEVLDMRKEARDLCEKFGVDYHDPAASEGLEGLSRDGLIDLSMDRQTMETFVAKDDRNIDTCTVLLVLTGDTPSDGSLWEQGRAYYHTRIPIVLVSPKRASGKLMGFSNIKAAAVFATLEAAIVYIRYGLREGKNV